MATYNYTDGDGVSVLDSSTPDGATEPVSILDDAVRQIKAYLLDPTKGPDALITALSGSEVGIIKMFGGSSIPSGYLLCNGGAVSRVTYAALFAVIGVNYGVGDSVTTFNLPAGPGRSPRGAGTSDAHGAVSTALGQNQGQDSVMQTEGMVGIHTHTVLAASNTGADGASAGTSSAIKQQTTLTTSTNSIAGTLEIPLQNPTFGVNFIIKY